MATVFSLTFKNSIRTTIHTAFRIAVNNQGGTNAIVVEGVVYNNIIIRTNVAPRMLTASVRSYLTLMIPVPRVRAKVRRSSFWLP